jgi:hypothetical protein
VDTLTIRLHWYSGPSLFGLSVTALCIAAGFFSHGAFGVAAIFAVLFAWMKFGMKIEATPADVGLSTWLLRRKSATREAIKAMHWYGQSFTFVDEDHRVLLKIGGLGWSRGQLLDLSEALGVRLYNHRTKRGLGSDAWKGQLMRRATKAK